MGQVQSEAATADRHFGSGVSSSSSSSRSASTDSLIAEAAAYGNDGNEVGFKDPKLVSLKRDMQGGSLDAKAHKALECPCIADLRSGPCGLQFSEAFLCYLKSTVEEKGSDCVHPFVVLQNCIKANPDAFSQDNLEEDTIKKDDDYKIYPPTWSRESQSPESKL